MFGLFKKKAPELTHYVYRSKLAKYRSFIDAMQEMGDSDQVWLLFHFDQTGKEIKKLLDASELRYREKPSAANGIEIIKAEEFKKELSGQMRGLKFDLVVVAEVHPNGSRDMEIYEFISEKDTDASIIYYTSLDSHLFAYFGGDRLVSMLDKMDIDEYERIEHSMITSSIKKAQKKMAESVTDEKPASSEEEWIRLNTAS